MSRRIIGLLVLVAACAVVPKDFGSGGNPTDTGGPSSGDSGDSGAAGDTADTGDSGDSGDSGDTGMVVGDPAPALNAYDQTGAAWSLADHGGTIVVIVVGKMYDSHMQDIAAALGELDTRGLLTVVYGGLDENETVADQADAAGWIADYHVDVGLFDPYLVDWLTWAGGQQLRTTVLDAGLHIAWSADGIVDPEEAKAAVAKLQQAAGAGL